MAAKGQAKSLVGKDQDVERIREILFGAQMREYNQRFATLQRDLDRLQKELERTRQQLAEKDEALGKQVEAVRSEARQGDEELRSELREASDKLWDAKVDRTSLGDFFVELGTMLKSGSGAGVADLLQGLIESE